MKVQKQQLIKAVKEQQKRQQIVVIRDHQYLMGETQFKNVLKVAKDKLRKDKKTAIYAVTKGNVTQMVLELYENAEDLRKAIGKYKSQGFHSVYYYLAV